MIVVDTNILVHFWLNTEQSELIEEVFKKDSNWVASLLWRSEFRNVILLYLRKELMDIQTAYAISEQAESQMRGREYHMKSFSVLTEAYNSECSAYDCEFVSLAKELETRLITFDKKIISNFPDYGISPLDYLS